MNTSNRPTRTRHLLSLVAWLASSGLSFAGSASYDFNGTGIQPGDLLQGSATLTNNELELTTAINSQIGSLTVRDLDPGQQLTSFSATFSILMGGTTSGTSADGIGFSVGQALLASAYNESGSASGLTVSFDTFGSPGGLDIRYYGRTVFEVSAFQTPASLLTNAYVPVSVTFDQTQGLTLSYNGSVVASNIDLNGADAGMGFFHTGSRFTFGGRTGGFNQNNFVDSISIATTAGAITRTNILSPSDTVSITSGSTPGNEGVTGVVDNNWSTKYLNLSGPNTGFFVTPSAGSTLINAFTITSANDSADRDPTSYNLLGSNDGTNYTLISSGAVPSFLDRETTQLFELSNTTPYTSYEVIFPTLNGGSLMQVAEVQFIGNAVPEPSTIALAAGALSLLAARRRRKS